MPTLDGCEFYHLDMPGSSEGEFVRLVRLGATVTTREGRRGSPGALSRHTFTSPAEAAEHVAGRYCHWVDFGSYSLAFSGELVDVIDGEVPDPEAIFLSQRRAHTFRTTPDDTPPTLRSWVLVTGLFAELDYDPMATPIMEYLTAHTHVADSHTDRIIARVHAIPRVGPRRPLHADTDTATDRMAVYRLGPATHPRTPGAPFSTRHVGICPTCTTRLPELLAFQLRDLNPADLSMPRRLQLIDTARRLAHLPDSPTVGHPSPSLPGTSR